MKPFSVVFDIQTAIQMGPYPLHLDGLLFWMLEEQCSHDREAALSLLDTVLAKREGVYMASAMAAYLPRHEIAVQHDTTYSGRLDWGEYPYPTKKKKIMTAGGPYRNRIKTYQGILLKQVIFHGVGDLQMVETLLQMTPGVGMNAKRGAGEISAVNVQETDEDWSWVDINGSLARVLPMTVFSALQLPSSVTGSVEDVAFVPPYNKSPPQPCLVPEVLRYLRYG